MIGLPLISHEVVEGVYQFRINDQCSVKIKPSNSIHLETGGSLWHACLQLVNYLLSHPDIVSDKSVVEIGAGCGLVGMVCAYLGAKEVILTDLPVQIPVLQTNLDLNMSSLHEFATCKTISCRALPFGSTADSLLLASEELSSDGTSAKEIEKSWLVIGSDIGYDMSLHQPIVKTINSFRYLNKNSNKNNSMLDILIAEEIRWLDIYTWFADELKAHFSEESEVFIYEEITLQEKLCPAQLLPQLTSEEQSIAGATSSLGSSNDAVDVPVPTSGTERLMIILPDGESHMLHRRSNSCISLIKVSQIPVR